MDVSDETAREVKSLAGLLEALANPSRLLLLHTLRSPRIMTEIRLPPDGWETAEDVRERAIARQAVRKHLHKLMEAGVVSATPAHRASGETLEYVVNHARLFAISEVLRGLALLRPTEDRVSEPTALDNRPPGASAGFPRLLVVRGLEEGKGYHLRPPGGSGDASWVIGRRREAAVRVDYDPYVSLENTMISWHRGDYSARDLPQSRNGTTVNFHRIPNDAGVPIGHGDVIGVGRTLFVLQVRGESGAP